MPKMRQTDRAEMRPRQMAPVFRRILCAPLIVAMVFAAGAAASAEGDRLIIVDDGRSDYEIVVGADAMPTTRLAADELAKFVRQAAGVQLPIVTKVTTTRRHIFILPTETLKPHAFSIEARNGDLYFRGRDSRGSGDGVDFIDPVFRGTCNAVYAFLERFLGVRWYWGDELGDVVPTLKRVSVPRDVRIEEAPFFDYRALAYGPPGSQGGAWARRNRLGSAMTMHHAHALNKLLPVREWATRGHPEYAALRGGIRRTGAAGLRSQGHLCLGNPEVQTIVAKKVKSFFATHPDRKMYSISPPDGSGMCMDALCRLLDVEDYRVPRGPRKGKVVKTDRVLHFYNAVADSVASVFPDRLCGGLIYADYLYPPRREVRIAPTLALVVAPNTALDLWDDSTWSFAQSLIRAWAKLHDKVYAYDTFALLRRSYALPAPMGRRVEDLIRLHAEVGTRGCYLYIGPTWESLGADAYVLTRLLWNPKVDVAAVRREYFGVLFQRASEAVRAYFETAGVCWRRATTMDASKVANASRAFHRTKEWAREGLARLVLGYPDGLVALERRLVEAERLAAGDPLVQRRVARVRDNYELTLWTIRGLEAVTAYERNRSNGDKHLATLREAIESRERVLTRMGASYGAELTKRLHFADKNVRSPLQVDGYYHKLALETQ